jgi:hypothetical protein
MVLLCPESWFFYHKIYTRIRRLLHFRNAVGQDRQIRVFTVKCLLYICIFCAVAYEWWLKNCAEFTFEIFAYKKAQSCSSDLLISLLKSFGFAMQKIPYMPELFRNNCMWPWCISHACGVQIRWWIDSLNFNFNSCASYAKRTVSYCRNF